MKAWIPITLNLIKILSGFLSITFSFVCTFYMASGSLQLAWNPMQLRLIVHPQSVAFTGMSNRPFADGSDVSDFRTVLRFWPGNHCVGNFFCYVGDFFCKKSVINISNLFNKSCYQQISSQALVTNIDLNPSFYILKC